MIAGELGEEHHAGEKEIDVEAFGDGAAGERERDKAESAEENGSGADPVDFGEAERAQEHEEDAEGGDGPDEGVGEQSELLR